MTRTRRTVLFGAALLSVAMATTYGRAGAQIVTPPPEELRFQALLNEPIAEPGRRGVVAGTSALLVKDRRTGQCFVAITIGSAMGLSPAACEQ